MNPIIHQTLIQCTFDFDALNTEPQKQCVKCKQHKPATPDFFPRGKARRDGFYPYCKECANKGNRDRYTRKTPLPEVLPEGYRRCTQCKELKPKTPEHFYFNSARTMLRAICRTCHNLNGTIDAHVHHEERRDYHQRYYASNREIIGVKSHQHYLDHIDYYTQRNRRYQIEKADYIKAYRKAHIEDARALKRASGSFTVQQIRDQHKRQKGKCYYCKAKVGKSYHIEHVVPLARGGSNDISNIVIACPSCNMRKQDKLPHEWPQGGRLL